MQYLLLMFGTDSLLKNKDQFGQTNFGGLIDGQISNWYKGQMFGFMKYYLQFPVFLKCGSKRSFFYLFLSSI